MVNLETLDINCGTIGVLRPGWFNYLTSLKALKTVSFTGGFPSVGEPLPPTMVITVINQLKRLQSLRLSPYIFDFKSGFTHGPGEFVESIAEHLAKREVTLTFTV